MEQRSPSPPFTLETSLEKIRFAEASWNSRNPENVAMDCSMDCEWRYRNVFLKGREELIAFLTKRWEKAFDRISKVEYWAHTESRIAVQVEYEYTNNVGDWCIAYSIENWEFEPNGLITRRYASINDVLIKNKDKDKRVQN
jgi:nuclear transport factor 2 (NTF2) superfamily protein